MEVLELGDCMKSESGSTGTVPLNKFVALKKLNHLRIEKGEIGREVGALEMLGNLDKLELIDAELKQGFSKGFIRLRKLKQLLLIPSYKDEVSEENVKVYVYKIRLAYAEILVRIICD